MRTDFGSIPRRRALSLFLFLTFFLTAAVVAAPAHASKYAGYVMDAKSGKVLYSYKGDERRYPASLTKMMTLYMVFEALEAGRLNKNTRIRFSAHASSRVPSKLGVKAGRSITAEQAILALVTKSANDAAAAIAEHLGGTESGFARLMTDRARQLGMKSTTFRNASGLPDSRQVTTARDMAILGIALREHFPQYYHYFSRRSFTFAGRRMGNHNRLLGQVKGVDGIKTGYIRASGFNLVTSVERNGRSIVAVVLGGRTGKSRNAQMRKLIGEYLPRATRGTKRMLVAKAGGPSPLLAATLALPKRGPLPAYRPIRQDEDPVTMRVATAHTVSTAGAPADTVHASADGGFSVATIARKLAALSTAELPVPAPAPEIGSADPVRTAAIPPRPAKPVHQLGYADEEPIRTETAASAPPAGWQIQIAAVDTREGAIAMLEKARGKAPKTLSAVVNYTETVDSGGATLHRARFAGFASKSQAWDACGVLKKRKFACLALAN